MISTDKKIYAIEGVIKNYPWGSRQVLAEHRGISESAEPEAELWFGDNPHGPSWLKEESISLNQLTSQAELGLPERQLPFLAKILAVERSLSLQVHPALSDIPNLSGITSDLNHKPEMVVALTEFEAFVGFSGRNEILTRVDNLNSKKINELIAEPLRAGRTLKEILKNILGIEDVFGVLEELRLKLENLDPKRSKWTSELIDLYAPYLDPIATLLCELRVLQPGESLFVPPKCVHAYLNGTVVEVMANSDNVLRGGLTLKPIDKENFLAVLDSDNAKAYPITPIVKLNHREWKPPIPDFELQEFHGAIESELTLQNFAIAFAWEGGVRIADWANVGEYVDVHHQNGALLAPGKYTLSGSGSLWVTTGKGR
jgi:mannose-6-phosphate isomerase